MPKINERTIEKFSSEILKNMLEIFDLLGDVNTLEDFLMELNEKQTEKLYSHPLLEEYDLLP